ncbi:hypothetical protein HJ171_23185 [Vibrio parahaemolyticus]|uniref:hypothetical protein n=1 Tax=Vibrio parahaemolyticus TaxID=670 RepID=UPI0006A651FC|nr:hypothetical protein [Vibrio parahaemolyticus]EHR7861162.1 hypothetical protein [Vibrio parahaemolyticus]EJC6932543.1 hypothetical protein [Vibrio parahaemolyticus]ELA9425936.1 hypothetical protein [Vibrio parahaemolyticus]ELB2122289.1 hypothetical protein [Vibrio parahaemolyticus]MBE3840101.1 hypothetical protein [Vibrio parahaemolyticus]
MKFYPYESVEIPRTEKGLIDNSKPAMIEFWESVEELEEGLSEAIGIYIFSVRAGQGNLPWYVGKAEKQTFKKECFTHHKLTHYNNCIVGKRGTPLLTLLPKFTPSWGFPKPTNACHSDINALEKMLIGTCLQKNRNLLNIRDTKLHKEIVVPGYINTPQGGVSNSVKDFKHLIGV